MRALSVFASAMALAFTAQAQQPDYGYGGQSQGYEEPAAAPSTIPGQRNSGARVPQVRPAAPAQRKPQPPAQGGIQWGTGGADGSSYPPYGSTGSSNGGYSPYGAASGSTGNSYPSGESGGYQTYPAPSAGSSSPYGSSSGSTGNNSPYGNSSASPQPAVPATVPQAAAEPPAAMTSAPRINAMPPVMRQRDSAPRPPPSVVPDTASANARLGESFRLLDAGEAVLVSGAVRGNSATRIRANNNDSLRAAEISAPLVVCAKNGNLPLVSRLKVATGEALLPGAAFVVQGNCYGTAAGTVRVMLPTPRGRIRAVDARVLNWEGTKLFAQLPADLQNVIPGEATVEVWTPDGRRSAAQAIGFEPQWALRTLPMLPARVLDCRGESAYNRCRANDDSEADPRFNFPKDCRNSGIGTCLGGNYEDPQVPDGEALIFAQHYTQDPVRNREKGRDVFELNLPPYLRPSHCGVSVTAFETEPGRQDASATARFQDGNVIVDWAFERSGEPGWLQYQARCQVWAPVGVVLL